MIVTRRWPLLLVCILWLPLVCAASGAQEKSYLLNRSPDRKIRKRYHKGRESRYPRGTTKAGKFLGGILRDMFILNVNLLSLDSFKIMSGMFPLFIGARMIDEDFQSCFYERQYHKNINQCPSWCHEAARISIGIPIVVLGSQIFLSQDREQQESARMLLLGLPFVIWGKDCIKTLKFDCCLRPWNEHFSCEKRAFGGFPSGHMAQATYTAVLYGMRYGPKYSIPLGILAGAVAVTFINCNRHYTSQIIAGAGLGALYAVAANKLIDTRLHEDLSLNMQADAQNVGVQLSYRF